MGLTRDFFIALSKNQLLNTGAKKWGLKLGASKVVAGTDIDSMMKSVKELNANGIGATIDNLGEFVYSKEEALHAKENILATLEAIQQRGVTAHMSIKLTQIGLDVDYKFCLENMREIVEAAARYAIFINIDMEDYSHLQQTMDILHELLKEYDNVGTVIQSYLYRSEKDLENLQNARLRLVKGAYKEIAEVSYQSKQDIDANFLKLIKIRLQQPGFTSIATHDHHIIDAVKKFVRENQIPRGRFEFQMLYGFRTDMQKELADEGFAFTTYVPFGQDWYGYYMRRLAERPQNINLALKSMVSK
ncbi:proline dehydrogenase [Planococcus glaciei]|uniref:proline dehydrogenase n=1 Tax=Planococcus glaciei TaxID=459472 RepID=A0A7H8Q9X8_9BACL|nr:proline dehydrogenase family protein [Planococcus glaciei]ETP67458.1 proline dehydrogenase [Planococcus glaciei CHR43]KOF11094.1 proline dehydrogenase [Planococcus glaciei]QDY45528.1 proline dehydrogenase [Planococcus glaciei]QKX50640.1 proline dehydrogenase [Planococcus glaciei]